MANLTPQMAFDYMGILLNRQKVADEEYTVLFEFTDTGETYTLYMRYGALLYKKGAPGEKADITVKCPEKLVFQYHAVTDKLLS